MTKIKLCGVTEERDAIEAVHLGLDAIGFVFDKDSPRYIPPREAGRITLRMPPFLSRIGVFRNAPPDAVMDAVYAAGLSALQFQGDESPEYCRRFNMSWYKRFVAGADFEPSGLSRYACTSYLLDLPIEGRQADTARTAGWSLALAASRYGRIILGGGLTPETVESAIATVGPYAVDVCGGVEFAPGKKDIDRLEAFVRAVRGADEAFLQREDLG